MEKAESEESRAAEDLQLTPQEERLLRSFFRRHALPYFAGAAALAAVCLAFVLARGEGQVPPASAPEPSLDAAALDTLRADLDRALADLTALRARAKELKGEAVRSASALEQRLEAALHRIGEVEARSEATQERVDSVLAQRMDAPVPLAPPAQAGAGASAAEAVPGDPQEILQRLYDIELRQDSEESNRAAVEKGVLGRLYSLELRRDQEEARRKQADESSLERLDGVEARLFEIERLMAARRADASPPPADAAER